MAPQFLGTVGVRSVQNQHKIIIECLYLLLYVICSNTAGGDHLTYETYSCDFAI